MQLTPQSVISNHLTQPRLILYYQTHNNPSIESLLHPKPLVTHIILAALHLNYPAGNIHLNDHPPSHSIHSQTWKEISSAQAAGVKVSVLLGGAAQGSFTRLDGGEDSFEQYYGGLRDFLIWSNLDGVDLDVEEIMSLAGVVRLVQRLRRDFGPKFLITAAPVASALLAIPGPDIDFESGKPKKETGEERRRRTLVGNMSGFSYQDLEKAVGREIAWYNAQFYCGWGSLKDGGQMYRQILQRGRWDPRKIVVGTVTNPGNGAGWTSERLVKRALKDMVLAAHEVSHGKFDGVSFGGMMGWEYANSVVAREDKGFQLKAGEPWLWAARMRKWIDAAAGGDEKALEETWDELAALWSGRFGEKGFGGSLTSIQDRRGRWAVQ